jgi:hypothetical protein
MRPLLSNNNGQEPVIPPTDPNVMPAPGSFKDDPEGAMRFLAQRASGQQLIRLPSGQLGQTSPSINPLKRLFGAQDKMPINQPDYFTSIQQAGLTDFIPQGVPRTPEGMPFISEKTADQMKQLAAQKRQGTPDPALAEFGAAFLDEAGSPAQAALWKKLNPTTQASLAGGLPGFRTKRQDYFGTTEVLSNGTAVQKNANDGKYYYAGTQIPYDGSVDGQQLPRVQKTMADSTVIQLGKTQTLINSIDNAAAMLDDSKFGLWQGTFNKTIANYTKQDPQAAAMFKQLKTVFTEVTHDLYGGTLTGNELDQATDLLFNQYQSAESVRAALGVQKDKFSNRLENMSSLFKASSVRGAEAVKPTKPKLGAASGKDVPEKKDTGTIRVKRKSDGKTGSIPAANFDPANYERI